MEIPHGIELNQGPTLGRPMIGLTHKALGDMGNPLVKPPDDRQLIINLATAVAELSGIVNVMSDRLLAVEQRFQPPWWSRLWEWIRNL